MSFKMENFEGFLHGSSSSSSLNLRNSHGYGEVEGERDNGILGLMAEMGVSAVKKNDLCINKGLGGTRGENEEKTDKTKKKGGNKKMRKARYAFQTRSQVDILDDGYRWRKYGQKAVKNNKFPRSYYRCTHQGCNVKKQVQRLTEDEGIVETTYEGMHSHPIQKISDNFEHILTQMQIYTSSF
ncbi:putative WRKY transcription factor 24 [Hibiscus syriacus]|uniref:WRKY transcription factor 24 n=1 Tax=Hibiscus syriacus TaxID=106335 RepID=A0A6A3CL75_HIBSY|nr:probable WRKY transcription factor 75 [Hibiscus syriacus]KAE8730120.1 putative WRKY transcription factor 24 [Hibiscus syriacus]